MLFGATKQAALENESSAYCLKNEKQLLCVWGDSNAWHRKINQKDQHHEIWAHIWSNVESTNTILTRLFSITLSILTTGAYSSVWVFCLSRRKLTLGSTWPVSCHAFIAESITSTRKEKISCHTSSAPNFEDYKHSCQFNFSINKRGAGSTKISPTNC